MISALGLLTAAGSSIGPWVHGPAVPSGDQDQIASSVGTTFSWKQTPVRIHHMGPFNMGPQWPRGQSLQPQFDKRIRKEAQRQFLTLREADGTPKHCDSEKPHLLGLEPACPPPPQLWLSISLASCRDRVRGGSLKVHDGRGSPRTFCRRTYDCPGRSK